jgi:hypothetical protein
MSPVSRRLISGHARYSNLTAYSIISSARASSDGETVNPSAFAVLRLTASRYFVGACAGRLAGFSPLKMRSNRGVVAGQDFDDHRIDGYHSS